MITSRRLLPYGAASTALAAWTVIHALNNRPNFYSAAVYLSSSNACVLILSNFGVFLTACLAKSLQWLLFGRLTVIEVERLQERVWYTMTESLLALTIFREEFDTPFLFLFVGLLFVKVFHWLAADRVDSMEHAPSISALFKARMSASLVLLSTVDVVMTVIACESVLLHGPSVMVMFASEYVILGVYGWATGSKFIVNWIDSGDDLPWEDKSILIFYVDLFVDFCKLVTYLCYFAFILTFYGLPLNILRDVYITTRSFIKRVRDLHKFKAATRDMESRYPDATAEEIDQMSDKSCIICREEFQPDQAHQEHPRREEDPQEGQQQRHERAAFHPLRWLAPRRAKPNETPKKLSCGHIFHFHCLRSWLERQQSCPTCRRPVLERHAPAAGEQAQQQQQPQPQQQRRPPLGAERDAIAAAAQNLPRSLQDVLARPPQQPPQAVNNLQPPLDQQQQQQHRQGTPLLGQPLPGQQPGHDAGLRRSERRPNGSRSTSRSPRSTPRNAIPGVPQHLMGGNNSGSPIGRTNADDNVHPFLRFSYKMPPDIWSYVPEPSSSGSSSKDASSGISVKSGANPEGRTFKMPRVAAPALGVPPALVVAPAPPPPAPASAPAPQRRSSPQMPSRPVTPSGTRSRPQSQPARRAPPRVPDPPVIKTPEQQREDMARLTDAKWAGAPPSRSPSQRPALSASLSAPDVIPLGPSPLRQSISADGSPPKALHTGASTSSTPSEQGASHDVDSQVERSSQERLEMREWWQRALPTPPGPPTPPTTQVEESTRAPRLPHASLPGPAAPRPSFELPEELSQQQLQVLGSLTREGLQNRLNLLNGMQQNLDTMQRQLSEALDACDAADRSGVQDQQRASE